MPYKTTIELDDPTIILIRAVQSEVKQKKGVKPSIESIIRDAVKFYLNTEEKQKIIKKTLKGLEEWIKSKDLKNSKNK